MVFLALGQVKSALLKFKMNAGVKRQKRSVILGKMAQHAPLLALFMAKLKGKSKSVSNMTLGKCIGL